MAELATPSGAEMFDAAAKKKLEKPEKPDEDAYKTNLKKAEKEHADSMAKYVCETSPSKSHMCAKSHSRWQTAGIDSNLPPAERCKGQGRHCSAKIEGLSFRQAPRRSFGRIEGNS